MTSAVSTAPSSRVRGAGERASREPSVAPQVDRLASLEQEMGVVVRRARRVLAERARAVDPELQAGGYLVLTYLAGSGPRRGAEVVECLGVDKGAISRQVQHLIDLGLVDRSPDPADGRAHLLSVTDDGRRRLTEVAASRRTRMATRLAAWSEADLTAFTELLARYNADLAD